VSSKDLYGVPTRRKGLRADAKTLTKVRAGALHLFGDLPP
jgi:hypothetical protein